MVMWSHKRATALYKKPGLAHAMRAHVRHTNIYEDVDYEVYSLDGNVLSYAEVSAHACATTCATRRHVYIEDVSEPRIVFRVPCSKQICDPTIHKDIKRQPQRLRSPPSQCSTSL